MRPVCRLLTMTLMLSVPALVQAQASDRKDGPAKGTWGGEASIGSSGFVANAGSGASLLRFMSSRVALVGGLSFARIGTETTTTLVGGPTTTFRSSYNNVDVRAGVRRYGGTGVGLRPVIGGGVLLNRTGASTGNSTDAGGYGEAGAAWFFNPHVSLGVLGGVSAVKRNEGWTIGGSLARLTGAVYF